MKPVPVSALSPAETTDATDDDTKVAIDRLESEAQTHETALKPAGTGRNGPMCRQAVATPGASHEDDRGPVD